MRLDAARAVADAVLVEGYALYPYRASALKNRYRWTFGVLAPRAWSEAGGCETWWLEAQLPVRADGAARLDAQLRFFQIVRRRVERQRPDGTFEPVDALDADRGELAVTWDEGVVRTVELSLPLAPGGALVHEVPFAFEGASERDVVPGGRIVRERQALAGRLGVRVEPLEAARSLLRVAIRVENTTPWTDLAAPREAAIAASFASTHVLVGVAGGELISTIDPPAWAAEVARACTSRGVYPALAGPPGTADVALCAPIVLPDHPQVAPESPGDLCDATEIDELLALRTLTLTDEEKRWARATDARTAEIVDRVEPGAGAIPDWLPALHGTQRALDEGEMRPTHGFVPGTRVRLRPRARGTDAQDVLYADRTATVEGTRLDVDGTLYVAVTIDDDPAAELHRWYGRFHYFRVDEVEVVP